MNETVQLNGREVPAPPYKGPDQRDEAIGAVAYELADVVEGQNRMLWWIRTLTGALTAAAIAVLAGGCVG